MRLLRSNLRAMRRLALASLLATLGACSTPTMPLEPDAVCETRCVANGGACSQCAIDCQARGNLAAAQACEVEWYDLEVCGYMRTQHAAWSPTHGTDLVDRVNVYCEGVASFDELSSAYDACAGEPTRELWLETYRACER